MWSWTKNTGKHIQQRLSQTWMHQKLCGLRLLKIHSYLCIRDSRSLQTFDNSIDKYINTEEMLPWVFPESHQHLLQGTDILERTKQTVHIFVVIDILNSCWQSKTDMNLSSFSVAVLNKTILELHWKSKHIHLNVSPLYELPQNNLPPHAVFCQEMKRVAVMNISIVHLTKTGKLDKTVGGLLLLTN